MTTFYQTPAGGLRPFRASGGFERIVRRRKGIFTATAVLTLAAAAVIIRFEPRVYQARAVVETAGLTGALDFSQESLVTAVAQGLNLPLETGPLDRLFGPAQTSRLRAIRNNLKVAGVPGHSVSIRFDAADAQTAARVLNAVIDAYIEQTTRIRRRLAQESVEALRAQLRGVETRLQQDLATLRTAPAHSELLKDRIEANRRLYASMLDRINQAGALDPGIRVVESAQPPLEPYRPNIPLELGFAVLAAMIMGTAVAITRDKTDAVIRTPEDAAGLILGSIPRSRTDPRSGLDGTVERIAWEAKDSEASESFRSILASMLSLPPSQMQTLLVTSPRAGEGKTTLASNLAIVLAEIQRRVLLVDADLRRPRMHAIFEVANTSGLGDLLGANPAVLELPAEQLVKKTGIQNLSLLSSGPAADGVFNGLYSAKMALLLCRLREQFDHVIIDAPPALEVADARALARSADSVVVVLRANRSDTREASAVLDQLVHDGASIAGIVLNDWPASRRDYRFRRSYAYRTTQGAGVRNPFANPAARS